MATLLDFRDSLVLPFILLLVSSGLYLTVKLGLFQVPNLFLGIKILSGNMDQKKARGKITHAEGFFAGSAFTLVPGAVIGSFLAREIAGPGVLFWIWLVMFPAMAIQYAAAALSIRFRVTDASGKIHSGPARYIEQALRARWLSLLYSGIFLGAVLLAGGLWPFVLLYQATANIVALPGLTLSVLVALALILIVLGGIRRIGLWAKILSLLGLGLTAAALVLLFAGLYTRSDAAFPPGVAGGVGLIDFLLSAMRGFWPEDLDHAGRLLLGVGCFYALTETGTGKNAVMAGGVRTDYPAKPGLASTVVPFFEAGVVMTLTMFVLFLAHGAGVPGALVGTGGGLWLPVLVALAVLCFAVASMSGWLHAGTEVARHAIGRRTGQAVPIVYMLLLLVAGVFMIDSHAGHTHDHSGTGAVSHLFDFDTILWATMTVNFAAALIPLVSLFLMGGPARVELRRFIEERHMRYALARDLYLLMWTVLPKNLLSRLFGWLAFIRLPRFMMVPILSAYARAFEVNLDEAELELKDYPSLNKFFTRALRDGARVVDTAADAVVSPVDGAVSRFGPIEDGDGRMIQAKGIDYSVEDLLEGDDRYIPLFLGGRFIVLYLSPRDYHRIHSPERGRILGYTYRPGTLFSVNAVAVQGLHGLFPKNERLTTYLQTEHGLVAVVKVGATNVGKISVTYDTISTNRWIRMPRHRTYRDEKTIGRGEELGRFEMGSTVILLFEKDMCEMKVRFGQTLGRYLK